MVAPPSSASAFRVKNLSANAPTPFNLTPDAQARAKLAQDLHLSALRKLSFVGELRAEGRGDFALHGVLGATVVQTCVVTLAPVTTRIDQEVTRRYLADFEVPQEAEVEMPEDETVEALGDVIDPGAVLEEALALALPLYPRVPDAELAMAQAAPPGVAPISDEETHPFAGLAELRESLKKGDG